MLGMYTTLLTSHITGLDPLLTIPVAGAAGYLLGISCYYGFVRFLLRGPMVAQLLGTFGLMLLLRNLALLFFGSEDRTIHSGIWSTGRSISAWESSCLPRNWPERCWP